MRPRKVGASTQPCFAPSVNANASETVPLSVTLAYIPSRSPRTTYMRESLRTAAFLHYFPESVETYGFENHPQVHEDSVGVGPQLLEFLLQLASGEDRDSGSAVMPEVTLAFREKSLFKMIVETVEEDASKDLPGDVEQQDMYVVITE
ncbi:hypothetical protein SprV_0200760700 [Sparganum proliferum]